MWKWVMMLAFAATGCASAETGPEQSAASAKASQVDLLLEVKVWHDQADLDKTRAFYQSLGFTTTQSTHEANFYPHPICSLNIFAGSTTLRITFVPHVPPFASWDTELIRIPDAHAEPDYPEFRASWNMRVTPERFEELRHMPGARVYQLDGSETIGLRDPAGLNVLIQSH
jgi:catechol 2,3-dioxygenase-like lactoylglutathione lyase family enzyme